MSDRDAKTQSTLCKSEPYGAGVSIVKHECVGHVQKQMGKQLRDLRKNKFQIEVIEAAATKRARKQYAKDQREASRGRAAGRSRGRGRGKGRGCGRGRASASGPVVPLLTPEEAVPPVMVRKQFRLGGQGRLSDVVSFDLEGYRNYN